MQGHQASDLWLEVRGRQARDRGGHERQHDPITCVVGQRLGRVAQQGHQNGKAVVMTGASKHPRLNAGSRRLKRMGSSGGWKRVGGGDDPFAVVKATLANLTAGGRG